MIAMARHPCSPPPKSSTPSTVTVWMSRLVLKAKMKRIDPIWTRSALFLVMSAVSVEYAMLFAVKKPALSRT